MSENLVVSEFGIYKTRIISGAFVVLVVALGLSVRSCVVASNAERLRAEEVAELRVQYKSLTSQLTQAQNSLMQNQDQMKADLSKDFQDQIRTQKLEILAKIKGSATIIDPVDHNGTGQLTKPNIYLFPSEATKAKEPLLDHFIADVTDSKNPTYSYKLKPIEIPFAATLNFNEKEGVTSFWVEHQDIPLADGKLLISVPKLEFTPSAEFTTWVANLRGKETKTPEPSKWNVNLMGGRDSTPGRERLVGGLNVNYNWNNGAGVGAGFIGSTVFVQGGLNFGKH